MTTCVLDSSFDPNLDCFFLLYSALKIRLPLCLPALSPRRCWDKGHRVQVSIRLALPSCSISKLKETFRPTPLFGSRETESYPTELLWLTQEEDDPAGRKGSEHFDFAQTVQWPRSPHFAFLSPTLSCCYPLPQGQLHFCNGKGHSESCPCLPASSSCHAVAQYASSRIPRLGEPLSLLTAAPRAKNLHVGQC